MSAITFNQSDLEGVKYPYDDALVVMLNIHRNEVKRIMINNGNSVYLLYYDSFK